MNVGLNAAYKLDKHSSSLPEHSLIYWLVENVHEAEALHFYDRLLGG